MSKLLKKTDGKLTRDQQARRYALVMLLPALIFLACLSQKGRKKTEFVNSVDEVERITGYDFFPQLPDDVEKRVEAKAEMF